MDLQRFSLGAGKIRVEPDLYPALPFVQGDSGQLQQVVMNLMVNARQALEQQGRGGTIRVRTKRIGERRVLLEVADDGPGIPQAIRPRFLIPFSPQNPVVVGTGSGLAFFLTSFVDTDGNVAVPIP